MADGSVIGRGTVVRGNVRGNGTLEIQGRVDGDVAVAGDVVLREEGSVRGNVSGAQISVAGMVQGDLRGTESVMVERGARVAGDLSAPRIGIANGALVRGTVRTDGEPAITPPRRVGLSGAVRSGHASHAAFPAKPAALAAKAEKIEPPRVIAEGESEAPKARTEEHRPPPPVVPVLRKGTKAKKKKGRDD